MGNLRLKGKDLKKIGYKSETAKSIAINIVSKKFKHERKDETLNILSNLLHNPKKYLEDEVLKELAKQFIETPKNEHVKAVIAKPEPKEYAVFGSKHISTNTLVQMEKAMMLPIAQKGALMPDAHEGYGLPIGGVFATKNEVLPYGVGLDIGCRMCLSIYRENDKFLNRYGYQVKTAIKNNTHFGIRNDVDFRYNHEVLDRPEFYEYPIAKKLHGKAKKQLGTSGSGNHFVESGIVELPENNSFGVDAGNYFGILSHSGSRGFGAEIARTYTDIAMKQLRMPKGMQHLAWLNLSTDAGLEYWNLMNLAGDYAKACHEMIHYAISKELGLSQIARVENHHNFAWKEKLANDEEYIVHRKGATPAGKGEFGIIPGSMVQPGYIVSGLGAETALNSASHGAGRKITRTKAKNSITMSEVRKHLKQNKVALIGGGVDEAPFVYKDLESVMKAQSNLVKVEGKFIPKIVRMDKH
jgi:tRNA-splicing ligase RtcB